MYYEDELLHPNYNENAADSLSIGGNSMSDGSAVAYYNNKFRRYEDDESTVNSDKKKQRKLIDDMKKSDKGYNKIKRVVHFKKHDIEVYSTNTTQGSSIRNAITGTRFKEFRVGSANEYQFFKVKVATGELNPYSSTLFFDSPEQYERHMKTEVPAGMKDKWARRCAEFRDAQYVPKNTAGFVVVR